MTNYIQSPNRCLAVMLDLLSFGLILYAVCPALAFGSEEGSGSLPDPRPVVTVDRLLAETPPELSGLRWLGDAKLVGSLRRGRKTVQTVWPVDGSPPSQLEPGEGGRLSPDGLRTIAREKMDWVVRELQGDQRELARVPAAYGDNPFGLMAWSRDSQRIALAQNVRAQAESANTISRENGVRYEDLGFRAQARDATGMTSSTITVLDVSKPGALKRYPLTGELHALEWGNADDLYFVAQPMWNTGGEKPATVVRVLQHGEQREVFRVGGVMQGIGPTISPDGRWMALVCDIDSQLWDDFNSLLVVDLASGKHRRLTLDKYVVGKSARWAPDSRSIYFMVRDGGWSQVYGADLDGKTMAVTETPTYKRDAQLSPNGQLLAYTSVNGLGVTDLRVVDIQSRRDTRIALLDDPGVRYRLGRFERVKFPTPDALNIAGWIIYPPDFDPAKKYPLYVDVHGGGPGSFLYMFGFISAGVALSPLEWHAWAGRGYLVFVPDYRSSGEYGPGVSAARHRNGDYGGMEADARDVEAGVTWMLNLPFVDATRVGLFGGSAGGARVNLMLTQSSRYRAGVVDEAIGSGVLPDFITSMTGSEAGATGSQSFWNTRVGDIADRPQAYLRGFLLDGYKSSTPTLIIVGGDRNAGAGNPLSAEALFTMLRRKGVPTRMLRYIDEGHNFHAPAARHAFEQIANWLATHMKMATDDKGNIVFEGGKVKEVHAVGK